MPYPIVEIPAATPLAQLEQLGTKRKFWYRRQDDAKMLFKVGRPGTGENWSEKVCCEICRLLGIPHAEYDLAVWGNLRGTTTRTFVPANGRLILGNELLARIVDGYAETSRYRARQHTVRTVMALASSSQIGWPMGWDAPQDVPDAAGVFAGYLMLDALVGNQDRHHENWGIILLPGPEFFLAPTFDHASSLGRNETDERRRTRLETKDQGQSIEAYVARAKSAFYVTPTNNTTLSTLDAFREAAKIRRSAARYWRTRLAHLRADDFLEILSEIPDEEITGTARTFACEMLNANARRILAMDI